MEYIQVSRQISWHTNHHKVQSAIMMFLWCECWCLLFKKKQNVLPVITICIQSCGQFIFINGLKWKNIVSQDIGRWLFQLSKLKTWQVTYSKLWFKKRTLNKQENYYYYIIIIKCISTRAHIPGIKTYTLVLFSLCLQQNLLQPQGFFWNTYKVLLCFAMKWTIRSL